MWSFVMGGSLRIMSGALAAVIAALVVGASAGFAQSTSSGGSDTAYLNALDAMVVDMDLDGLASQTFEAESVTAPTLSSISVNGNAVMDDCAAVLALSEANGIPTEIFGADAALTEVQRAALSECLMPETGAVVSYLALEN